MIDRSRRLLLLAGLAATSLAFAGCGKRGPLEPPPDAPEARKRDEQQTQDGNTAPGLRGAAKRPPPIPRPTGPFILDPLLD